MSISIFGEGSKNVLQQLETQETSGKQESLLTDAFEHQIKLVEKLLTESKTNAGSTQKKKKKNTGKKIDNSKEHTTKNPPTSEKCHKALEYTHRSRIYRYETDDGDESSHLKKSNNERPLLHPPTDLQFDLSDELDVQTDPKAKMLMSWYMAGYHTGYYDAISKYKRDLK